MLDLEESMNYVRFMIALVFCLSWQVSSVAAPLVEQWRGSGADADKLFCKYGDGKVVVVPGSQNCPLSN